MAGSNPSEGHGLGTDHNELKYYVNIPDGDKDPEHKFDDVDPIYSSIRDDANPSGFSNESHSPQVKGFNDEPDDYDSNANAVYSTTGSSNDGGNDFLEHQFENPIYGNENETQSNHALPLEPWNADERCIAPCTT